MTHEFHFAEAGEHRERPGRPRLEESQARGLREGRLDVLGHEGVLRLQRLAGNSGVAALAKKESPVHEVLRSGGGVPLPAATRNEMEARLGHDFGDVRVHTDARATESARSVQAHAYTVGSDIVFQRDRFQPESNEGKHMLAHELTHVVQQRSGPVDGTPAAGGIQVSDPGDRFEREAAQNADLAMSRPVSAEAGHDGGSGH